ncbi:response regulator [Pedomonas sp. V897]|uniref:response regulator n=1 Tax=Pedomonas sp. V897 TaxID=3446482 RepID=UPI003EE050CD
MEQGQPSVLLVDDEPLVMRLLGRALEPMGLTPRIITNGFDALEEIRRDPPALVMTDYHMPGMTGVALCDALVRQEAKTCPVILLSGDDETTMVQEGLRAGVDDFLVKGMPFALFMERVRFWTAGPFRALPPHIRAASLEAMNRLPPLDAPVARLRSRSNLLVDRATMVISDQLASAPKGFGQRPEDRARLLGVLDRVLAILARTCWVIQLQRTDALVQVVERLNLPWGRELLQQDLPRLTELRREDGAFNHAAVTLSVSVE